MLPQFGRCSAYSKLNHCISSVIRTVRPLTSCASRTQNFQRKALDCDNEDFYSYSAQRWIWNEPQQLRSRYVKFDVNALIQVAEKAAGNGAVCARFSKLAEGSSNKAFLVAMQDGLELVVKIPNPNAGPSHYTTASEVATMQYTRESLGLPVPRILDYCSDAADSKLGTEYMVMEKAKAKQIGTITSTLSQAKFPCHGSLYRCGDVSDAESMKVDDTFVIGPTTGRSWFDDKRREIKIYRGPWSNTKETMGALAQREQSCLNAFSTFPRDCQQGIYNGPGGYRPTKEAKLAVLQDFLKIYPYILPKADSLNAGIIWHNDLHTDNIFVDKHDHTKITSIIDWQATPVYPMFLVAHHPSFIEYDGPRPERFVQSKLPENIASMDAEDKKAAKDLFLAQTIWLMYEVQVYKESRDLTRAFEYQESLQAEILGLIGSTFDDGEPHVQRLIATAAAPDVWKKVVGEDDDGNPLVPCPVQYTDRDLEGQDEQHAKWERDIERKARVLEEIGLCTGWNGAVSPGDYDEVVRRLAVAKQRFLDRESKTPEERAMWERVWPFEDKVDS